MNNLTFEYEPVKDCLLVLEDGTTIGYITIDPPARVARNRGQNYAYCFNPLPEVSLKAVYAEDLEGLKRRLLWE
jgi:hypothetical protein